MISRFVERLHLPTYPCTVVPARVTLHRLAVVKPCSAANFPAIPYQVILGLNCDPLLLLPYQYPGEACVQVYAVITLALLGRRVPEMITNTATINLCNPISCSSQTRILVYRQTGSPLPLTGVLSGVNCNYTVEWYNEAGQLVSTSLRVHASRAELPERLYGLLQGFYLHLEYHRYLRHHFCRPRSGCITPTLITET